MKVYTIQAQAFATKISDQEQSNTPTYTHKIIHIWYGYVKFTFLKVHSLAEFIEDKKECCLIE
jgi:hypothetical protein